MMAWLFLGCLLPTNYQHLLYIDGDMYIWALISHCSTGARGCLMAAPDPMTFESAKAVDETNASSIISQASASPRTNPPLFQFRGVAHQPGRLG